MIFYHGVATINRLLQMIGLFCKRALQKRLYSAKETFDFKEPTNRSHPIYSPASSNHRLIYNGMGWLRLVGSLQSYVYFAKQPYERDYILQKRPIILRSVLIVATS